MQASLLPRITVILMLLSVSACKARQSNLAGDDNQAASAMNRADFDNHPSQVIASRIKLFPQGLNKDCELGSDMTKKVVSEKGTILSAGNFSPVNTANRGQGEKIYFTV